MLEDPRQRVPVGGVASARRDQRSRRVGRDELDRDPLRRLGVTAAEPVAGVQHGPQAPAGATRRTAPGSGSPGPATSARSSSSPSRPHELGRESARRSHEAAPPARAPAASRRSSSSRPVPCAAGGRASAAPAARRRSHARPRRRADRDGELPERIVCLAVLTGPESSARSRNEPAVAGTSARAARRRTVHPSRRSDLQN